MNSIVGVPVGLFLGMWSTWSLRRQTRVFLARNEATTAEPFVYGWLFRLGIAVSILVLLIGWSPSAGVAAIFGYWLSRTVFLVGAHDFV